MFPFNTSKQKLTTTHFDVELLSKNFLWLTIAQWIRWQHIRCCRLAHWFQKPQRLQYTRTYVYMHTCTCHELCSLYSKNTPLHFQECLWICTTNWYFNVCFHFTCMLLFFVICICICIYVIAHFVIKSITARAKQHKHQQCLKNRT